MIRRSIAGLVLGVSLLFASLAWSGYLALQTVLDPDRSRDVAVELLDNDQVRDQLARNIASTITAGVPAEVPIPPGVVESAALRVLDDPAFEELVLVAFADTHAAFLGEGDPPAELDLAPLAASLRAAVTAAVPALGEQLPPDTDLTIDLPTEYIPDASPLRSLLQTLVPILALAAVAGAVLALVTTTDRPSVLRRAGAWAIGSTVFYLAIGLGLPWLLRNYAPDGAEIIAALLTAFLRSVVRPSIVLGAVGLALVAVAAIWPDGPREHAPRRAREPRPARAAQPETAMPTRPAPQRARPAPGAHGAPPAEPGAASGPVASASVAPYRPAPAPRHAPHPDGSTQPMPPRPRAFVEPSPRPGASVFADAGAGAPDPVVPVPGTDPTQPAAAAGGDPPSASDAGRVEAAAVRGGWMPPRWVAGVGWVLDPNDPKPPPSNARWVDGVGYVVPGPPP